MAKGMKADCGLYPSSCANVFHEANLMACSPDASVIFAKHYFVSLAARCQGREKRDTFSCQNDVARVARFGHSDRQGFTVLIEIFYLQPAKLPIAAAGY